MMFRVAATEPSWSLLRAALGIEDGAGAAPALLLLLGEALSGTWDLWLLQFLSWLAPGHSWVPLCQGELAFTHCLALYTAEI